mmetsp:Transcript_3365/g.7029  ORF Transcript_3365/g.7029 Transcript_3365/m.7029 type:complete len:318 (-) Transcript_3365:174-1127(-)|eukprot:CAMPEP_0168749674 /NCGR_PEP_ID=MMETSP0724-20121128/16844_1 /TAXON_ID=265536 /ORGANISM="Amphiprora sp., Strain CCMP467" /LENGTH=317 /DNA_ID=CAMNT_0008797603 /DNA_START=89 /DNA_END=1042 /DNA_ORIENTATION=-
MTLSKALQKDSRHLNNYLVEPQQPQDDEALQTTRHNTKKARTRAGARDSIRVGSLHNKNKKNQGGKEEGVDKVQTLLEEFALLENDDLEEPTETTASSGSSSSSNSQRRVQFTMAHFHEHAIIMGDNPSCMVGYPLTIDWDCLRTRTVAIPPLTANGDKKGGGDDDDNQASTKRSYSEMRLKAKEREVKLKQAGYTKQQLVQLCRPVNIDRARRSRTMETMALHSFTDAMSRVSKKLGRVLLESSEEQQKRASLKQWRKGSGPSVTTSKSSSNNNNNNTNRKSGALDCIVPRKIRKMNSLDATTATHATAATTGSST